MQFYIISNKYKPTEISENNKIYRNTNNIFVNIYISVIYLDVNYASHSSMKWYIFCFYWNNSKGYFLFLVVTLKYTN